MLLLDVVPDVADWCCTLTLSLYVFPRCSPLVLYCLLVMSSLGEVI